MAPPGDDSSPPEELSKARHVSRKLFKRRHKEPATSVDMPEHLKSANDTGEEEITATSGDGPPMYMDMNQSIFGLITAAGSRLDFTDRFNSPSSDEEDDDDESSSESDDESEHVARATTLGGHAKLPDSNDDKHKHKRRHRRSLSKRRLLRSLPALPRLAKSRLSRNRSKSPAPPVDSRSDASNSIARSDDDDDAADSDKGPAPMMSRMLEARAEMAARPSFDLERLSGEGRSSSDIEGEVSPLARKLKEIFEFDEPEEVIEGMQPRTFEGFPTSPRPVTTRAWSWIYPVLTFHLFAPRISMLAVAVRPPSRVYVHHDKTHLLLCLSSEKRGKPIS